MCKIANNKLLNTGQTNWWEGQDNKVQECHLCDDFEPCKWWDRRTCPASQARSKRPYGPALWRKIRSDCNKLTKILLLPPVLIAISRAGFTYLVSMGPRKVFATSPTPLPISWSKKCIGLNNLKQAVQYISCI